MKRLPAIFTLLILTACAAPITVTPTPPATTAPTAIPSDTPPPTVTPTSTVTLTSTPSPTSTIPPGPTPALSHEILNDIFFGGISPECPLPCWHGLRIGISDRDDVQGIFDEVFGFHGYLYDSGLESPPGYDLMYHLWGLSSVTDLSIQGQAMIDALINTETDKLETLEFNFMVTSNHRAAYPGFKPDIRPQHIVRELGAPDSWFVHLGIGGQGEGFHLGIRSLMIYDNGVAFYHIDNLPVELEILEEGEGSVFHSQFCLGERYFYSTYSTFLITEPLTDGLDDLTPAQDYVFRYQDNLVLIQEVFGLTAEEITQWVMEEDDVCLPVSVPD